MAHAMRRELDDILGAIREVETNLDRRDARAYGAVLVMWGLVAAGCFLYAYSVAWFPEHHAGHSDAYMTWFWTLPVSLALVVTLFVGARRWRIREESRDARIWWLLGAMVIPVAATVVFLILDAWWSLAAVWVAWAGVYLLGRGWRDDGRVRRARQACAAAFLATAAFVALARPTWAYLAAAVALGLGLGGLGLLKYLRGE